MVYVICFAIEVVRSFESVDEILKYEYSDGPTEQNLLLMLLNALQGGSSFESAEGTIKKSVSILIRKSY